MTDPDRNPDEQRDDVAALVRLAGRRESVPVDRFERARAAAETTWRQAVRRRTRRRVVWAGGLATAAALTLAAIVLIVAGDRRAPGTTGVALTVQSQQGTVWSRRGAEAPRAVAPGDTIAVGSELFTPADGRVAVRLPSGHSVRLDGSTTIQLVAARAIALDRGAIYVDSGPVDAHAPKIEIRTPLGRVEEIGTQFEARLLDGALRLRLREGAVILRHDDEIFEVDERSELELQPDGTVQRRTIEPFGEAWAWVAEVTPMLDVEGRTARFFLDWVARERGLSLAFADASVARAAADVVVAGRIEGMTLDQALDAVLPSCRMQHRIHEGILVVDHLEPD